MRIVAAMVCLALAPFAVAQATDPDGDGDGLSDFHEIHKHRTDPKRVDSDGDGIPDGDWRERREYQYTVRSIVQVMKPVTIDYLTDDYQDARVLDETKDYVELEVIHYPFNTVADAIAANADWRVTAKRMKQWTKPGPSSDWTPAMRRKLIAGLKQDGIDAAALDDRTLVTRASKWLLDRADYHDGFSTFITAFDEQGRPFVPEELRAAADSGRKEKGLTLEEQWAREISAHGMFENRARGSCSSSAIYLSGCLRALGIPTRTVLCIPFADASDERELELVRKGISHHGVRRTAESALSRLKGSWSSHTFNEVYVDGRWRRLNYTKLGQDIYDRELFGLMTHVATFSDWADANMPATVGRRQGLRRQNDVFGGPNPYSTIALRDEFGVHCEVENPLPNGLSMPVSRVYWTDSDELPDDVAQGLRRSERFGLIAHITGLDSSDDLGRFLERVDGRVFLEANGHTTLKIGFDPGCWWYRDGAAWIYVPFGPADKRDLVTGVAYRFRPRNQGDELRWLVSDDLKVVRD